MKYIYIKIYTSNINPNLQFVNYYKDIDSQRQSDIEYAYQQFGYEKSRWDYHGFISSTQQCVEWSFANNEDLVLFKLSRT